MIFETQQEQDQYLRTQGYLVQGIEHVEYLTNDGDPYGIREADPTGAPISRDAVLVAAVIMGSALMICDALKNGRNV